MTAGSSVPEAARAAATEAFLEHMGDDEQWSETVGRALEAAAPFIVAAAVAEERATVYEEMAAQVRPGDHHCFKPWCPECAVVKERKQRRQMLLDKAEAVRPALASPGEET